MRFLRTRIACSAPQLWRILVITLVLIISILQIVHITLLSRLEARRTRSDDKRSARVMHGSTDVYRAEDIAKERLKMLQAIEDSNVLDVSGEYNIINDLQEASSGIRVHNINQQRVGNKKGITLVTQSTLNHLGNLSPLVRRWAGPVSVAIFATQDQLPDVIEGVIQLRSCYSHIRHNVSFHLVYPVHSNSKSRSNSSLGFADCATIDERLRAASKKSNYAHTVSYPVNLLRNVGRRNSMNQFVLVIDIDILVSSGLHDGFMQFAKRKSLFSRVDHNEVYVVPVFEAHESIQLPNTKKDLLVLIEAKQVRPFYFELCHKCQKHTDYEAWSKAPTTDDLDVIYQVDWKDPWEPFYIAHNSAPMYDERFRQYGFNRISQTCELHVAGYSFGVLNNAFLVHRGLKVSSAFHAEKEKDLEKNRLNFRQFKTELKEKYTNSARRCY